MTASQKAPDSGWGRRVGSDLFVVSRDDLASSSHGPCRYLPSPKLQVLAGRCGVGSNPSCSATALATSGMVCPWPSLHTFEEPHIPVPTSKE